MKQQSFYFAKVKLTVPDLQIPDDWEQFRKESPFAFEIKLSASQNEFHADQENMLRLGRAHIIEQENGWLFVSQPQLEGKLSDGALLSSRDYTSCIINPVGIKSQASALSHLRTVMDAALPLHGGSILHASCVIHKHKAVLFCGPSGAGKSTQAALWNKRFGAYMLSSDAPAIYPDEEKTIAYGMPWDGSDHVITQEHAPVAAIMELKQAKYDSIRRLSQPQAFRMLMKQGHLPFWDNHAMLMEMHVLKKLSKTVPFYRLNCRPDTWAVELVNRIVYEHKFDELMMEEKEMRIKKEYQIRNVMDEFIVMPTGAEMKNFEGAIVLSKTAAFVWKKLEDNVSKSELVDAVLAEYEVDEETAEKEVAELLEKLNGFKILENLDN